MSTLAAKLATIYTEVTRFEKTKAVTGSGPSYKYTPVEEIADYLRLKMGELGVVMVPSGIEVVASEDAGTTKSGTTRWRHVINMTWTITDGETSLTVASVGESMDTGDKGMNKAQTAARKYALINAFQLSTGDDPDRAHPEPAVRRSVSANVKDRWAILVGLADGDAKKALAALKAAGITSSDELADDAVMDRARVVVAKGQPGEPAGGSPPAPTPSRRNPDDPTETSAPAGQVTLGSGL